MDKIKKLQFEKDPFVLIDELQRDIQELRENIVGERFSSRDRMIREVAIAKKGKFRIEQKDSLPTTATLGEITFVGGRLYECIATDTWALVGIQGTRAIAAGTGTDSPTLADGLIQCSTSAGQALVVTLPEAANSIGLSLLFTFVTDGGQNITINRTGADTIDETADLGNTAITMEDAADQILIQATQDNIWMVIKNIGCTLS